jgi:hypothetical protein
VVHPNPLEGLAEPSKFSRDLVVGCYNDLVAKDVIHVRFHVRSVASEAEGRHAILQMECQ